MIASNTSACKLAWIPLAVGLAVTTACGDDPAPPTAPTAITGMATGLLRGEAPIVSRSWRAHPPLRNATVIVVGGPASGSQTATRDDGTFEIAAAGTFRLRFEHPSFITTDSPEMAMIAGGVTMPEVVMVTAPWSISGRVTDSLGNAVPDAEVAASYNSYFAPDYGRVRTDATGRFVITSSQPRFDNVLVAVRKAGFEPSQQLNSVKCCGEIADIRIVRIVSVTPTAPSSLRVGESVEMPASVVVFDNGVTRNIFILPTSGAPSVVTVAPSSHWYAMRGVSAGVTTLTFDLWGAIARMQVQVR